MTSMYPLSSFTDYIIKNKFTWVVPNVFNYPRTCVEGLRKTASHDSQ
jgi:hypothetical protein